MSPLLIDIREAFWLLIRGCGMTGGGFSGLHLEPVRVMDAIALAEVYGFEPLYFVRVIQPSVTLYRDHTTDRLSRKT